MKKLLAIVVMLAVASVVAAANVEVGWVIGSRGFDGVAVSSTLANDPHLNTPWAVNDISAASTGVVYASRDSATLVKLNGDLSYTGIQTTGDYKDLISVDVGADGYVYCARGTNTALKFDPVTLAYAGVQSDIIGNDISVGTKYGYISRDNETLIQVDKDTLQYTGVQTISGYKNLQSVDVGADGYVYCARAPGLEPLKFDPVTLVYMGVTGSHSVDDITVGVDYAYGARGTGSTIIRMDKSTLQYDGTQSVGYKVNSIDVVPPPPPPRGTIIIIH